MSNRTAEAHKAIRLAWQREHELIQKGKGTRDWTEEQQRDILDKGKAYDDSGRAFDGQHMKSAEKYPEYQGDPGNIQFLTREEHLAAHKGSWQNPTNWYYDPATEKFFDFGEDTYIPCKVLELSNPVVFSDTQNMNNGADSANQLEKESDFNTNRETEDSCQNIATADFSYMNLEQPHNNQASKRTVLNGIKRASHSVKEFSNKHPVITAVVEIGVAVTATAVAGKAIGTKFKATQPMPVVHRLPSKETIKAAVETVVDTAVKNFDFKKAESVIKQMGYTVAKSVGLSDIDRQRILQQIIEKGIVSKETLCSFLERNINLHKNQSSFAEAVSKWIADLAYIKDNLQ